MEGYFILDITEFCGVEVGLIAVVPNGIWYFSEISAIRELRLLFESFKFVRDMFF